MWDKIMKWWNRKWSNWSIDRVIEEYSTKDDPIPHSKFTVLRRVSNDGLVQYKRVEI